MTDTASPPDLCAAPCHKVPIPRNPSDEMVAAPIHVAFCAWPGSPPHMPWATEQHWVAVIDSLGQKPRELYSHTTGSSSSRAETIAQILRNALDPDASQAWVVVPAKHTELAAKLRDTGLSVTRTFRTENRAVIRALALVHQYAGGQRILTQRHGWQASAHTASDDSELAGADAGRQAVQRQLSLDQRWWPQMRRVSSHTGELVVIATDASCHPDGSAAISAVTTSGDFAVSTLKTDAPVNELELRAITLSLSLIRNSQTSHVTILSDNLDAVVVAAAIADGLSTRRKFRGIPPSALKEFKEAYEGASTHIYFLKIKGHSGHELNEAAHMIAGTARQATLAMSNKAKVTFASRVEAIAATVAAPGRE